MSEPNPATDDNIPLTTMYVRRAVTGDMQSLGCVVARLSPLLLHIAAYRLGPTLRTHVEPEDLVNEAWVIALPKLAELGDRDGRITPVLLKFLTTTMNFRINQMLRKQLGDPTRQIRTEPVTSEIPSEASGVITKAVRHEQEDEVRARLDELDASDREIILLRGIEQNPSKAVAVMLGLTPNAVDQRYSRALKRLQRKLPRSVFWELESQ
jgi:RNA polymerase sigma-70 factor, ECF subfamily